MTIENLNTGKMKKQNYLFPQWYKMLKKYHRIQVGIKHSIDPVLTKRLERKFEILRKRIIKTNRRWAIGIAFAALSLWLSQPALSQDTVDVHNSTRVESLVGGSFTDIGDFNNDGNPDVIIQSPLEELENPQSWRPREYQSYLIFGDAAGLSTTDVHNLDGENGFVIDRGTGFIDINNDGFDDIFGFNDNKVYVLFGTGETMPDTVSMLNAQAGDGFSMYSPSSYTLGDNTVVLDDINGDGIEDLALIDDLIYYDSYYPSYILFGKETAFDHSINLDEITTGDGLILNALMGTYWAENGVAVGDLNGDNISDLALANPDNQKVKVLFGQKNGFLTNTINWDNIFDGINGMIISDNQYEYRSWHGDGFSIPGDINHDGFDDLLINTSYYWQHYPDSLSYLHIVYGSDQLPATFSLDEIDGVNGDRIIANIGEMYMGAAGDINADGIDDFIISEANVTNIWRDLEDTVSYVLYGNCSGFLHNQSIEANLQQSGGLVFPKTTLTTLQNSSDINRDGYDDLFFSTEDNYMFPLETDSTFIFYSENGPPLLNETICEGESIQIGDEVFTETGNYQVTLTNQFGCDSIVNLELTVHPLYITNLNEVICSGENYTFPDGTTETNITANTSHISNLVSQVTGCDSTITTNITVNPVPVVDLGNDATICYGSDIVLDAGNTGETYIWSENGQYTQLILVSPVNNTTYSVTVTNGYGCSDSDNITVNVQGSLANFNYSIDTATYTVSFTDISTGEAALQYWTFGDGNSSNEQNPVHQYDATNNYTVCLTAYDIGTNCQSVKCEEIQLSVVECEAGFSHEIEDSTNTASFTNSSTGNTLAYYWNFGDATSSSEQSPVHQYNEGGYQIVSLSIRDTIGGCIDEYNERILLDAGVCMAMFSEYVDVSNLTANFTNNSTGSITNWYWDFGDGNTSVEKEPGHIYDEEGLYEVRLTVSDTIAGCMDEYEKDVQVGNSGCSANFSYWVNANNNQVHFTNELIGYATEFTWEFGEGGIAYQPNPVYNYPLPGIYTVSLNTYNKHTGCMDEHTENIVVGSQAGDCQAGFLFSVENKEVVFTDNSIAAVITNYTWDFDDGTLAYVQSPVHEFDSIGVYNVCLSIEDSLNNCINTSCKSIMVDDGKNVSSADFIYTVDSLTNTVYFADRSLGKCSERTWNFIANDLSVPNAASEEENPVYPYSNPGLYVVSLKLTGSCQGEKYRHVNVNQNDLGIRAFFGYEEDTISKLKEGLFPTDFIGVSYGTPAVFAWDFGDGGANTTSTTPMHIYTEKGTYSVCFKVSDPYINLEDIYCDSVRIGLDVNTREIIQNTVDIKIYPNPSDGTFFLALTNLPDDNAIISILNIHGQEVYNEKAENIKATYINQITLKDLQSGIYLLKIQSKNIVKVKRVVIQ